MKRWLIVVGMFALLLGRPAWAEEGSLVFKLLAVNPSETEVKEVSLRGVLPPEIKAEDVLEADGLDVAYESQMGAFVVTGTATLKPKESLVRNVLLRDVWVIASEQFDRLSREVDEILQKLSGTAFLDRGQLMAAGIRRRLETLQARQSQSFIDPQAHISQYREDLKQLQLVETELVSLRQLMVMAALNPDGQPALSLGAGGRDAAGGSARDGLSVLTTWRLVFMILGLLGVVSLSFFFVWQRQLKAQLARQAAQPPAPQHDPLFSAGNGGSSSGAPPAPPKAPLTS